MRRGLQVFALAFVMIGLLFGAIGCGGGESPDPTPDTGTTPPASGEPAILKVALRNEPASLDHFVHGRGALGIVDQTIHESLMKFDDDANLVPGYAEEMEIISPTHYRFHLRDGLVTHAGNVVDAQFVVDWHEYIWESNKPSTSGYVRAHAEVVDPLTWDLKGEVNLDNWVARMSLPYMGLDDIIHRQEIGEGAYGENPSGLGPFKLKEWVRGSHLIFEAFDDYYLGRPQIDEIHYFIIPDAAAQLMALEVGEVDIITALPPHEVSRVLDAPQLDIVTIHEMRAAQLILNVNDPRGVLSDVRVRRGLAHAMNSAEFVEVLHPALSPIDGVVHSGVMGHVPGLNHEYDPDLAEQLLNEAGWERDGSGWFTKDGRRLAFDIQTSRGQAALDFEICELVQTQLADFGVRVGMQMFEVGAWADLVTSQRTVDVPELGVITEFFGVRTGDPTIMFNRMYSTGGLYNIGHFSDPEYDRLSQLAAETFDHEEKLDAFRQMQQIIHDEVLQWTFGTVNILYAANADVKGFHVMPPQSIWWTEVWLDR